MQLALLQTAVTTNSSYMLFVNAVSVTTNSSYMLFVNAVSVTTDSSYYKQQLHVNRDFSYFYRLDR